MKPMVEFCASNMHHGTQRIMELFQEDDSVEVIEYGCLGNCGECYMRPYALVDGEIVGADDVDELFLAVQEALKRQKADREALDKLIDDL
nr:YuzB family protein [Paenibacillus sp. HB172176]